jgi:nitrogen fixation-related uncharacterized protein
MFKKFLFIFVISLVVGLSFLPGLVLAKEDLNDYPSEGTGGVWNLMRGGGSASGGLNAIQGVVYEDEGAVEPLPLTVLKIVRAFLSLLGAIFLVLTIYAGFLWMTSGGNEEQVGKAKKILRDSIIGLAIVITAYAITLFVFNALVSGLMKAPK